MATHQKRILAAFGRNSWLKNHPWGLESKLGPNDLHLDSLYLIEMLMEVEVEFSFELDLEFPGDNGFNPVYLMESTWLTDSKSGQFEIKTIQDLLDLILTKLPAKAAPAEVGIV